MVSLVEESFTFLVLSDDVELLEDWELLERTDVWGAEVVSDMELGSGLLLSNETLIAKDSLEAFSSPDLMEDGVSIFSYRPAVPSGGLIIFDSGVHSKSKSPYPRDGISAWDDFDPKILGKEGRGPSLLCDRG